MIPTFTDGDHLFVLGARPKAGRLVVLRDPRELDRLIIKRVESVLDSGEVVVLGDNASSSSDSRLFGPVPRKLVLGRPFYRYSPVDLAGVVWFD